MGKAGGQPGTAFSLVYGKVTDRVWDTVYSVDAVLAEWIRYTLTSDVRSPELAILRDSCSALSLKSPCFDADKGVI